MYSEMTLTFPRISDTVKTFIDRVLVLDNKTFHADELRNFVMHKTGKTAPASADRILRALRGKHKINYRIVSRSRSLYEALPLLGD